MEHKCIIKFLLIIIIISFPIVRATVDDNEPVEFTVVKGNNLTIPILVKNVTKEAQTGAFCLIDIFNESGTKIIDDLSTTEIGEGLYTFTVNTTVTNTIGYYYGFARCTKTSLIDIVGFDFTVTSSTIKDEIGTSETKVITEVGNTEENLEDVIKEENKETKDFVSEIAGFLNSELMKGVYISTIIGLVIMVAIIARMTRRDNGGRDNTGY